MTDWIEHNGRPQPVADDVWVEVNSNLGPRRGFANGFKWHNPCFYRILNQHLIDAARLEGIRLGLEAAEKAADAYDNLAAKAIQRLNPDTIAKELRQALLKAWHKVWDEGTTDKPLFNIPQEPQHD